MVHILSGRKATRAPSISLRDWQVPHAESLATIIEKHGAAGDLSDTGAGKTFVGLHVAKLLGRRPLIVGQKHGASKWLKIAVGMRSGFFLACGWEEAKSKKFPYNHLNFDSYRTTGKRELRTARWDVPDDVLLLFDEAHRGNGYITQNALLMAAAHGIPTLMMSATLASKAKKMYAPGFLLGLHQKTDFSEFCDRYPTTDLLHPLLFPEHCSRLSVDQIPGFPKNNIFPELVHVEHTEKMADWRKELATRTAELEATGKRAEAFAARQKYRQAAELERLPAILERIEDHVEEGRSVAVFVCFRESLFRLAELLKGAAACVYGQQPEDARTTALADFQANRKHVVLCTHDAGGTSEDMHDLHGRPRVSLISPPENPTQLMQTLGRICRDGAKSPAMQYLLFMEGVEEEVYQNVMSNCANIKTLNDGLSARSLI